MVVLEGLKEQFNMCIFGERRHLGSSDLLQEISNASDLGNIVRLFRYRRPYRHDETVDATVFLSDRRYSTCTTQGVHTRHALVAGSNASARCLQ